MSNLFRLMCNYRHISGYCQSHIRQVQCIRTYATNIAGLGKSKKAVGVTAEKLVMPVETDPNKLVNFCCGSNILKDGKDVELKPDNEYPDWLWNLRIGPPEKLEELDPNTLKYWRKVRKAGAQREAALKKLRRF